MLAENNLSVERLSGLSEENPEQREGPINRHPVLDCMTRLQFSCSAVLEAALPQVPTMAAVTINTASSMQVHCLRNHWKSRR